MGTFSNWLKKYIPTVQSLKNSAPFKKLWPYFRSTALFKWNCQTVARGVAAGLAGAVLPGFQLFYAAILALILRGNLPIALLLTLVTNPLTVIPIVYLTSYIGNLVGGNGQSITLIQPLKWDFSNWHEFGSNFFVWFLQFGKSYFIGLPILSLSLGIIGYFSTIIIWKGIFFLRKKRK